MFLADLHTWYLGGRGPLAGTSSCRWLLADRPCSPMPGPPPYRFGICTRHSVPRPPGNVAWHVPRWCTRLEEWTIQATASLMSFFTFSLELLFVFTDAALSQKWHYHWGFSKLTTALSGAMGTVAACCYFSASGFRQRLAPIWVIRLLPLLPGWWGVSTSELLHKCWWEGQLTVRCDVQRGVTLLISQWPSDVSAWSPVYGGFLYRQHPEGQKKKTVWWIKQSAKNI